MDMLHAPPVFHEFGCKPVQQFRVTGRGSVSAEIEFRRNQGLPEMPRPQVIDGHTGSQWIARFGNPLGQLRTSSGTFCWKFNRRVVFAGVDESGRGPLGSHRKIRPAFRRRVVRGGFEVR